MNLVISELNAIFNIQSIDNKSTEYLKKKLGKCKKLDDFYRTLSLAKPFVQPHATATLAAKQDTK